MKFASMVAAASLLFAASAQAQSSTTGLTGLGEIRTPDVVEDNGLRLTFMPGRYTRLDGNADVEWRLAPAVGFVKGFGDKAEAGIRAPLLMHESESSLGNVTISAKRQLWQNDTFRVAGSVDVELPTGSKSKEYSSGDLGVAGSLLGSASFGKLALVASFGYGTSDYCQRCSMSGAQSSVPGSIAVTRAAGGASFPVFKRLAAFAEIHALIVNNGDPQGEYVGDPDLYALVGVQAPLVSRLAATAYVGTGLANRNGWNGSNTETVASAMLHYTFGSRAPAKPMGKTP